ncbi:hypothetical protein OAE71_00395 [Synechococcus sp. AH-551-A21]|nr:hypothetical protein [Synechococcus sp. AH-551-A21]MDB4677603.1 hypothetical protein [Synechococcus sp. AH-551-A21]
MTSIRSRWPVTNRIGSDWDVSEAATVAIPKLVCEVTRSLNRGGSTPLLALLLGLRFCSSQTYP